MAGETVTVKKVSRKEEKKRMAPGKQHSVCLFVVKNEMNGGVSLST